MKYLRPLVLSTIAVFAPLQPVLLATLGMVLADFITGVLAALKRKDQITSSQLKRTIVKLFIFHVTILMAFLTEKYFTGDFIPVQKMVTCFIGLTELTSILENLNEISGGSLMSALIASLTSSNKDKKE